MGEEQRRVRGWHRVKLLTVAALQPQREHQGAWVGL